jgi:hypothetical protein
VSCFTLFVSQSVPLSVSQSLYFVATFGVFVFMFCTQKYLYNRPYRSYIAERNYVVAKFLTILLSAPVPAKTSRKIGNKSTLYALFVYIIQKSKLFRNTFLYSEELILPARSCIIV